MSSRHKVGDDYCWKDDDTKTHNDHFRGSKYRCSSEGEIYWKHTDFKLKARSGYEDLSDKILEVRKGEGGSFRITETGDVITKCKEGEVWRPKYVCAYPGYKDPSKALVFENVDVLGTDLKPGDIWRSYYDGARYSVKRGYVWWRNSEKDVWQRTQQRLPRAIWDQFNRMKPSGGSFRITENGKVLTLIPQQPLPRDLKAQYEALSDTQKRLLTLKIETTRLLPVFLGDHQEESGLGGLRSAESLEDPLGPREEEALLSFLNRYDRHTQPLGGKLTINDDLPDKSWKESVKADDFDRTWSEQAEEYLSSVKKEEDELLPQDIKIEESK